MRLPTIRDPSVEGENGDVSCTTWIPPVVGGAGQAAPAGPSKRTRIYRADTWHVSDGVATDGSGRPLAKNPVRRVFTPEYKLAILAEYDGATETGERGAILRREVQYSMDVIHELARTSSRAVVLSIETS